MQKSKILRWAIALAVCAIVVFVGTFAALGEETPVADGEDVKTSTAVDLEDGEDVKTAAATDSADDEVATGLETEEIDLTDADAAQEYVDSYADNLSEDENFESNIETALSTVRKSIPRYATFWALLPPIIAILLALITKEVYSSLFIGILFGGMIYSNFSFEGTMVHTLQDGFISSVADSYNIGILIFLVMLGAMVAMMNKADGS